MGDEEIIKRRLLIDGDGTGDDRRLNMLLKNFIKWCNTNDPQDQMFFDRLIAQWAQCTFAAQKSKFSLEMIRDELKNYEKLSVNIDKNIEEAKEELESSKANLSVAKKIRKNREEYDVLAKVIMSQPDRKGTAEELEKLRTEMNELHQESKRLDSKIKKRQKSFRVLMSSIRELELLIDDFDSGDESEVCGVDESALIDIDEGFVVDDYVETLDIQAVDVTATD